MHLELNTQVAINLEYLHVPVSDELKSVYHKNNFFLR